MYISQYRWTKEAIRHASRGHRSIALHKVEQVLVCYNEASSEVQVIKGKKACVKVFQMEQRENLIMRVIADISTNPWTIITYYFARKKRYWL